MNDTKVNSLDELQKLIAELTTYTRPVSYNLSEIKVVELQEETFPAKRWWVTWRKDGR